MMDGELSRNKPFSTVMAAKASWAASPRPLKFDKIIARSPSHFL